MFNNKHTGDSHSLSWILFCLGFKEKVSLETLYSDTDVTGQARLLFMHCECRNALKMDCWKHAQTLECSNASFISVTVIACGSTRISFIFSVERILTRFLSLFSLSCPHATLMRGVFCCDTGKSCFSQDTKMAVKSGSNHLGIWQVFFIKITLFLIATLLNVFKQQPFHSISVRTHFQCPTLPLNWSDFPFYNDNKW